jgi:hypothetical protein
MSAFHVKVVARNPLNESRETSPVEALVESRSQLTWLPRDLLEAAGITPRKTLTFETATGELATREVGFAILAAEGFDTADEVVFAEAGDVATLGVRTLDGFAVAVDYQEHKFVARVLLVAAGLL